MMQLVVFGFGNKAWSTALRIGGVVAVCFIASGMFRCSVPTLALLSLCLLLASAPLLSVVLAWSLGYIILSLTPLSYHLPPPDQAYSLQMLLVGVASITLAAQRGLVRQVPHPTALRTIFFVAALFWTASPLVRDFPAITASGWCLTLWSFVWALRPLVASSGERTATSYWANAVLAIVSTFLALGLAEIVTRLAGTVPAPTAIVFRWVPDYGFLSNPGGAVQLSVPLGDGKQKTIEHRISSQGLRDRLYGPKAADEYRILMLGDSFTQGHAVTESDTIPRQLERIIESKRTSRKVTVVNAGLCAAGPLQELGMLKEYGLALNPDLVILQLFPANDIENALLTANKRLRAYDSGTPEYLEVLRLSHTIPFRAEHWMRQHCYLYRAISRATRNKNLVAESLLRLRLFPLVLLKPLPPREPRSCADEPDLREWYPELDQGMATMKKDILSIASVCRDRGLPFYAYCIPKTDDILDEQWAPIGANPELSTLYERGKILRLTQAFLDEQGIPSFSVATVLAAHTKDSTPLYHVFDGHLTEYGNEVVATEIGRCLMERELKAFASAP